MYLFRSPGNWLVSVFVSSMFTITSSAEVLPSGVGEAGRESLGNLLSYLPYALVALLVAGIVFIKYRALRGESWKDTMEERDFKRLVEESVHAGRSTMEKPTG